MSSEERIGNLEVEMAAVGQKLVSTTDILDRLQNTMEKQTEILSNVLVIQEKQTTFQLSLDKASESLSELDKRLDGTEVAQASVQGWMKGIGAMLTVLLAVMAFTISQNVARVDKIEADYYKPTLIATSTK